MSAKEMVDVALSQVGYLEKASNYDLDSFTGNAGSNNYTKYARDIWPSLQAQPWCDIFVSWCAEQTGDQEAVGKYAYCPSHVNYFKNQGQWHPRSSGYTPGPGDIIFFQSGGEACHVGIVKNVSGGTVYTIEGNTSGASGLIPNGGGVCVKSYNLTTSYILGYGKPSYKSAPVYQEGWVQDNQGWWYRYSDGTWPVSEWKKIDGKWYYFKEDGYMAERQIVGGKYYVGADGTLVTNRMLRTDGEGRVVPADLWCNTLADVPKVYREELDKLIADGKFRGKGGEGESLIVDLPESAIRVMIVDAR